MTWTRHGHHIPGTNYDTANEPETRVRCFGVQHCRECSLDASASKVDDLLGGPVDRTIFPMNVGDAIEVHGHRFVLSKLEVEAGRPARVTFVQPVELIKEHS